MLLVLVIVSLETPQLVKKRLWKELVVFSIILSLGMIYSVGQIYNWSLPNPEKRLEYMVKPFLNKLSKELFLEKT